MSLKDYKPQCLDSWAIERLRRIKDDDSFIFLTDVTIGVILGRDTPDELKSKISTAGDANRTNDELDKVRNALSGLSDDARALFNISLVGEEAYIFDSPDDQVGKILNALDTVASKRSPTHRRRIGEDALRVFKMHGLRPDSSRSGDFTRYLAIILLACNLKHDENKLARDILND